MTVRTANARTEMIYHGHGYNPGAIIKIVSAA